MPRFTDAQRLERQRKYMLDVAEYWRGEVKSEFVAVTVKGREAMALKSLLMLLPSTEDEAKVLRSIVEYGILNEARCCSEAFSIVKSEREEGKEWTA
jgi:hypothetical protein